MKILNLFISVLSRRNQEYIKCKISKFGTVSSTDCEKSINRKRTHNKEIKFENRNKSDPNRNTRSLVGGPCSCEKTNHDSNGRQNSIDIVSHPDRETKLETKSPTPYREFWKTDDFSSVADYKKSLVVFDFMIKHKQVRKNFTEALVVPDINIMTSFFDHNIFFDSPYWIHKNNFIISLKQTAKTVQKWGIFKRKS